MYKYIEAAKIALTSILSHKLRSFLTLLGVIIGVAVVTAVATVIEGANVYIKEKIATLGSGVFSLQKASITGFGDFQKFIDAMRRNPDLTPDDLVALREQINLADQIGATDGSGRSVKYGNVALESVGINGVTSNMILLTSVEVAEGRYLSDYDDENHRNVAFVGAEVAEGLFPNADPLGKEIKIGKETFEVIGVAKKLGSVLGQSQDNFIQVPLNTFIKTFGKRSSNSFRIIIRGRKDVAVEKVQDQVRVVMRSRHKLDYNQPDNFSIATDEVTEQLFGTITGTVAAVAFPVVGISLVIGGIVIMNIMLATVTERTREIGIRKSLGATRRDILVQFLIESAMLSGFGGLIGLLLAVALMTLVGRVAPVPVAIPLWAPIIAIGVSTMVGIFFGIYPANRAARLDP
ncbi:MAG TPA: ABC transporter permease, partial [Blastocatellia bacterium]|nr:ABC transporter permease [Blastocatellia bacterium]